ncbi:methylated-DNA--[protein]-cysteine S-methyltransferase [Adhaeribacter sp. BT258]|uniref:Methylated-DNA--protein-cysteine methyltransferase n=1 Tax=Adhaeribacter terrigena TaxID=2793070 RepID=A0ABS1C442_9BACT|nr:methylated-DNA--[protein]-cysteine S-methyltransferase [Adhaeribacter terrigena]MBK0404170.1 methylated-DNA--[protein]-cysteine S-methyltransferase [Adhaeribacter terrigena]
MPENIQHAFLETPLGWLQISGTEEGITAVTFLDENPTVSFAEIPACLQNCYHQLSEYFKGERRKFELLLVPTGTDFQQKVWQHLNAIPFGKTRSYLEVALQLGEPTYTRAVGSANGKNPLAIVVPCHRVIGANGSLTGYAGGLWRKKWLLQFEGITKQTELFS